MPADAAYHVNEKRALDHLMALLAIEGLSGQEGNVATEIRRRLLAAGCRQAWLRHDRAHKEIGKGYQVGNLIVRIPGAGPPRRAPRLLVSGHMDTVPLCRGAVPVIRDNRIVPKGPTALGGDDRTAVAAMLVLAESLIEQRLPHPPLTLAFTVGEETGLNGARVIRPRDLGDPVMGFNIDGASPEVLVIGAIGVDHWVAKVYGRSTHAGGYPEGGISAALIASRAVAAVASQGYFGRIEINGRAGTSNVGSMVGGEATNQVTDFVEVTGESRSHSSAFLKRITDTYQRAFEAAASITRNHAKETGRIEFEREHMADAFRMSSRAAPVNRAKRAIRALGGSPRTFSIDGALDANHLHHKGIPTVTLGAGQNGAHTIDEFVDIPQFVGGCRLLLEMIASPDQS